MDTKARLKEAREAIKNKNFRSSIKICRDILNEDSDNYLALVFLGLSIQETEPSNESEKLFRRATEINPDNLLAWNGLANYYESLDTTEAKLEVIKIYTFLIGKETTEKKLIEYCEKLCRLYKYTNVEEICKVICDKVETGNYSDAAVTNSRTSLVSVLKQSNDLSDDILEVYEDILSNLINNNETITPDYYSQYLTVLYKQKKMNTLFGHVIKMYEIFPEDINSFNWICRLYNENYVENDPLTTFDSVNIKEVQEKLLTLQPQSPIGMLTKAIHEVQKGEFIEAQETLKKVTVVCHNALSHAWILFTRVNIVLHAYDDAAESALLTTKFLKSKKFGCDITWTVTEMLMEALSRSSEASQWTRAVDHYEKLDEKSKEICLPHFIRASIKLGKTIEVNDSLTRLEQNSRFQNDMAAILRAQLLRKQGRYEEALAVLSNCPVQTSEWYLELGITYCEMKQLDMCLLPFLKAAKSDPNNFYCFFYLGRCYTDMKEFDKARKCYERSYKLCPNYGDAALELSKIYRIQKNWNANIALLQTITKDTINKQNMWAWMQMGLNFMEQGNYDEAIDYLRKTSRIDPNNAYCWESLADAYLSNGSYTSAQKAYEKVLEISEGAHYAALQIAKIKKDLGQLSDAIADFEQLLNKKNICVLTLAGLAETCLKVARQHFSEHRLGSARDYAQYGVEVATRAIQQCSEISCLWKILGDCCMVVAHLPEKYCCLLLLRALDEGNSVDGEKILEKEDLMQFSARCYCKASLLTDSNELIWHDLAVCYLFQAKHTEDRDQVNDILIKAQAIVQHCTTLNPTYSAYWNLMGNIALTQDPPNYALAQHAFIKAVTLDRNSAVAWTNLGVLYSTKESIKLANQAFAQAQRSDPNYVQSWIGQGLLAEILGQHDEAMDLFRHSTSLGFHTEGALGYGHWVCRKLMESPPDMMPYVIRKLYAIPVACDALTWYTERNPYNCCAWNMLGILRERMGLIRGAAESFRKALNLSTEKYADLARINYGRLLTKLGLYKEAIKICSDVQESSFNSGIWYALALYKDNQFQESSSIYLAIAQYLAKDKHSIGDVIACMAIITYVLEEPELAKKTIIESFAQRLPTARVMYALIALGVLQGDTSLVALTLKQVEVLEDVPKSIEDFISLLSYVHIYQNDHMRAVRKASMLVHLLPGKSCLWLTLALTLLHSLKVAKSPTSFANAANRAAHIALELKDEEANHKVISKIHCTISTTSSLVKNRKAALIAAQKAVHCTPNAKECWIVLSQSLEYFLQKNHTQEHINQILFAGSEEFEHIRVNSIF